MNKKRFDIFLEQHLGLGLRWQFRNTFPFTLSIAVMFVTITIGFGKKDY